MKTKTQTKKPDHICPLTFPPMLFVMCEGEYMPLKPEDILYVNSQGNYAHIHTRHKVYINRISLNSLMKLLPAQHFTKVHKCYLIRIDAITRINKPDSIVYVAEQPVPIGRSFKTKFFAKFDLIN